jgi:hypothetical protein
MKIALLIPFHNTITKANGWCWQTPSGIDLSIDFFEREDALGNRPNGYLCMDDGWGKL